MSSTADDNLTAYELSNLNFLLGYTHQFRYYRSLLLDKNIDTINETFSDLTNKQRENIVSMLNVDLMVNAVMYCEDLALMLMVLNKPFSKTINSFSSIREKGSGSVEEFYKKVLTEKFDYFWQLMNYDKFYEKSGRYRRSCRLFINDLKKVADFFLRWYQLLCAYKHGLNVSVHFDANSGNDVLMMGERGGTSTLIILPPVWIVWHIEIVEIIRRIFERIIDPLVWNIVEEKTGVDLKEEQLTKTMMAKEPINKSGREKVSIQCEYPWKIHQTKEQKPLY